MNFKAYLNINFIFIFLFSILSSQAFAVEDEIEFNSNINQLSAKSLKDKGKVIDLLIESSNPNVEKVLQSLLEGKVFFVKKDKTIVLVKKNKNEFFAKDIITGKSLGIFSKRQIKKVTINNSIRKKIKSGLSILNLQNSDDSVRLNAVKNSYNNIDSNLYKKIQDLVRFEKNEKIRNAMFVLLDIYHLDSIDKHIKIQAIKNLSNNLEPVVKNKLFQIKNNEKNLEIKIEMIYLKNQFI